MFGTSLLGLARRANAGDARPSCDTARPVKAGRDRLHNAGGHAQHWISQSDVIPSQNKSAGKGISTRNYQCFESVGKAVLARAL